MPAKFSDKMYGNLIYTVSNNGIIEARFPTKEEAIKFAIYLYDKESEWFDANHPNIMTSISIENDLGEEIWNSDNNY